MSQTIITDEVLDEFLADGSEVLRGVRLIPQSKPPSDSVLQIILQEAEQAKDVTLEELGL